MKAVRDSKEGCAWLEIEVREVQGGWIRWLLEVCAVDGSWQCVSSEGNGQLLLVGQFVIQGTRKMNKSEMKTRI